MFGTNNHYIQDDGCGHEIICALRPVNSGENTDAYTCTKVFHGHVLYQTKFHNYMHETEGGVY